MYIYIQMHIYTLLSVSLPTYIYACMIVYICAYIHTSLPVNIHDFSISKFLGVFFLDFLYGQKYRSLEAQKHRSCMYVCRQTIMNVCQYVFIMFACFCILVFIYVPRDTWGYAHVFVCIYIDRQVWMYMYSCRKTYISLYVSIYVCMYTTCYVSVVRLKFANVLRSQGPLCLENDSLSRKISVVYGNIPNWNGGWPGDYLNIDTVTIGASISVIWHWWH